MAKFTKRQVLKAKESAKQHLANYGESLCADMSDAMYLYEMTNIAEVHLEQYGLYDRSDIAHDCVMEYMQGKAPAEGPMPLDLDIHNESDFCDCGECE